jgi:CheY-like chemotaxis protein
LEAVGTLAGGIAHDFNNILGAILGFGEMALRSTRAGSRMRRDVELIVKAGERGRALVERILAFSRTGFGERMPVQVEAVVKEVLHLILATLPENVCIESDLRTGPAAILGDSTQLHQVVMNLATNAVQAMPNGGQMLVTLNHAAYNSSQITTTGELGAGEYLILTVADTGVGISPDIVARIFDPFFTTREVDQGTGLGLSLVHGIVAEFGGKVNVATTIGSGTKFTVYLPRVGDVDESLANSTDPLPRGENECVLVVDDEKPLLTLMTNSLEALGYRTIGCSSSVEALLAFKEDRDRFDALVTDERMSGLSGTALIQAVRELRPHLPTVLVSGFLGGDVVARARQAGVDAVLGKPLATRELARAMQRALRLRK